MRAAASCSNQGRRGEEIAPRNVKNGGDFQNPVTRGAAAGGENRDKGIWGFVLRESLRERLMNVTKRALSHLGRLQAKTTSFVCFFFKKRVRNSDRVAKPAGSLVLNEFVWATLG